MAELLVVNPVRRKLSAKQIAAGFGGGGKKKRRKGRRGRKRSRSRSVALAGPRSARKRSRSRGGRRSIGGSLQRLSLGSMINETLIPAGIGAAGALGVDAALNMLSPQLPAFLQTGPARSGVKLAAAIALGMVVSMIAGRRYGEQVLAGAAVVTAYDFLKPYAAAAIPQVAGYDPSLGYWSPAFQLPYPASGIDNPGIAMDGMGAYVDNGMGAYVDQPYAR